MTTELQLFSMLLFLRANISSLFTMEIENLIPSVWHCERPAILNTNAQSRSRHHLYWHAAMDLVSRRTGISLHTTARLSDLFYQLSTKLSTRYEGAERIAETIKNWLLALSTRRSRWILQDVKTNSMQMSSGSVKCIICR